MKTFSIAILLLTIQIQMQAQKLQTDRYAGVYQYGDEGTLVILAQTDDTVSFYFNISADDQFGTMYELLKIENGKGHFCKKFDDTESDCRIDFEFSDKSIKVTAVQGAMDCGFGFGIYADGDYVKTSKNPRKFLAAIVPGLVASKPINYCK